MRLQDETQDRESHLVSRYVSNMLGNMHVNLLGNMLGNMHVNMLGNMLGNMQGTMLSSILAG